MPTKPATRTGRSRRLAPTRSAVSPKPDTIANLKTECSKCNLRGLCMPCCGLTHPEIALANRLAFTRLRVRRGESLYRTGERFSALYAVRKGFFKSVILLEDGRRDQVTGYAMAGEIVGMDGIATEQHSCNTIALEDSDVCAIPFAKLQELAQEIPGLQRHLYKTMSREIVREHGVMLLLGSMNADERLAMFLLNMSRRFASHGYSPSAFNLRMSRDEIGSYLGVKLETVSRTLSKFQAQELIRVHQKSIHILDSDGLAQIIGREPG